MDIVGKRKIFLIISAVLTVASILAIVFFGFKLSIEFTGGSVTQIKSINNKKIDKNEIENAFKSNKINVVTIKENSPTVVTVRTDTITDASKSKIFETLNDKEEKYKEESFNTLGPVIGSETRNNSLIAVGIAIVGITTFIAFAFRKVSRPVSSWKFGISAIIALIHDVLIVLGVFAALGFFFGVEIDTLFITAILTIMGFSIHDTIVVFDRIRENLLKNVRNVSFEELVNTSFNETLARSLNTSNAVLFVLFALILFGGESIRWFIVAFLVGILAGTYSSIFVASALLVEWYMMDKRGFKISKYLPSIKKQGNAKSK